MIIDGLTTCPSALGPKETMDRLVAAVTAHGMAILARIDHAAAAAKVGMELRPTEVLIFGNARTGTPLMRAVQTVGIELPLKALVWQDAGGKAWISYNEPARLVKRHDLNQMDGVAGQMESALAAITRKATYNKT